MLFPASCPTPLSRSHWGMQVAKSGSCGWENWTGRGRVKWSWLAVWIHRSRGLVSFSLQLLYRLYWGRWHERDSTQGEIKHTQTGQSPSGSHFPWKDTPGCHDLKPLVLVIQSPFLLHNNWNALFILHLKKFFLCHTSESPATTFPKEILQLWRWRGYFPSYSPFNTSFSILNMFIPCLYR